MTELRQRSSARATVVLTAGVVVVGAQAFVLAPLLPDIAAGVGASVGEAGRALSAYGIGIVASALLLGRRLDAVPRRTVLLAGMGALGGMFWGMLFGLIFLVPLLGAAIGAAMGALTGALTDVGIDDDFIKRVREKVTPGTSALFVLTSDAVLDRVADEFRGTHAELISTNLSAEQEAGLRHAFEEPQEEAQRT